MKPRGLISSLVFTLLAVILFAHPAQAGWVSPVTDSSTCDKIVGAKIVVGTSGSGLNIPAIGRVQVAQVQGCCTHQGRSVMCPPDLPPGSASLEFVSGGTIWRTPSGSNVFVPSTSFPSCPSTPSAATPPAVEKPPTKPPTPPTAPPVEKPLTQPPTTPVEKLPTTPSVPSVEQRPQRPEIPTVTPRERVREEEHRIRGLTEEQKYPPLPSMPSEEGKGVDTQIKGLGELIKQQETVPPGPQQPPTTQEKPPVPPTTVFNGPLVFTQQIENATKPACGCSGESTYNQGISIAVKESCPKCEKVGMYPGIVQDAGTKTVFLHNGEFSHYTADLEIPGRGFNWKLERKYRSGVIFNGPLGHGWEFNYNRRLFVEANGSVIRMDGLGRADRYELVGGGYSAPTGFYTRLVRNPDGTFTERDMSGIKAFYSRPDAQGIARLTGLWDRNGNRMRFEYNTQGQLIRVIDTLGRPILYHYNMEGRLVEVEDFIGRKVRFGYDPKGDLVTVTSPSVTGTPNGNDFPNGKTTRYAYSSGFSDERLNHNLLEIVAPNEVATGGPPYIKVAYDTTPSSPSVGRVLRQTIGGVNASGVPAGGTISYEYRALGTSAPNDFASPVTQTTVVNRNGNRTEYQFNRIGNIVRIHKFANRKIRPGDPEFFETRYEYNKDGEMIRMIFPEGNSIEYVYDDRNPDRFQQGNLLAQIQKPDSRRGGDQQFAKTSYTYEPIFNQTRTATEARGNDPSYIPQNGGANNPARYTTTYVFDYQEGQNYAALANELGVSENVVRQLLGAANIPMGLGDVNGDGRTDQISGNVVKVIRPTVNLPPGSNMARIEGRTQQPIVELSSYNQFGQITKRVDPEGNADLYEYYPENDPSGSGKDLTPGMGTGPFGYLKQMIRDAISFAGRDSGTNPSPTKIRHLYQYDRVGNVIREVDGRGIATDYAVNQLNQVVQIVRASAHNVFAPDPAEPLPLTDFKYMERNFYHFNNNIVRRQVEDRGNTSSVGANNGGSGTAFVDYETKYDILNNRIETSEEVSDNEKLVTRYRYDPNGNHVLVIQPEGNAVAFVYDERDLVFHTTRGATQPPPFALLRAGDLTIYDVRGGQPSTITHRYDLNRNQTEVLDGRQQRTRVTYDGFDRRTSVIDGVGNQTVAQYDPVGNVVRSSRFGPVGGANPASNSPTVLSMPVSSGGVIQTANLVNSNLLMATESLYDELSRVFQINQVLFLNTIPTMRPPDVAEGAVSIGKGSLNPGATDPIPGLRANQSILGRVATRTEYDRKSRQTFTVQDDGDTFRTFYDGADRVSKTVDPEGNMVEIAYDNNSNVIETRETDVSQVKGVPNEVFLTSSFYDSVNRLQRSVDNIGQTFDYRYDSRNNLVAMADAQGPRGPAIARRAFVGGTLTNSITNRFGNVMLYSYDGINRKVREDRVLTTSGQGDGINISADLFGVKTTTPTPDPKQGGGDGLITMRHGWDRNSLQTSLTDDNGNQTQYTYDNLNRRLTETKGICVSPKLADRCDVPTTIISEYDEDDNVVRLTDENGSIVQCKFDAIKRRTACQVTRGAGVVGTTANSYEYDGLSRLTRATDNNEPTDASNDSIITFAYDSLSRLIEETQQVGAQSPKAISSAWRAENLRSGLTYPNGRLLDFTYDRLDRLKTIADHGAPQAIADYDYIGPSRVLQRRYPINGTRMTYLDDAGKTDTGYDGLRRPVQLRHLRADNSLVVGFTHTYDRMNNKRIEKKLHDTRDSELYGYDSVYRLIKLQRGTLNATKDAITLPSANVPLHSSWKLDGVGNWKQVDGEARQHSSFNEVVERQSKTATAILSDNNGNETDDGTYLFKWDAWNRLRTVTRKADGAPLATFSYDAIGRRTRKVVTDTSTANGTVGFYLDGGREIEERNATDALVQQYVYSIYIDEPLVLDRNRYGDNSANGPGDQRLFYHQNTQVSVFALTDGAGKIVEGYQYDAYGRQTVFAPGGNGVVDFGGDDVITIGGASVVGNPYLFTGRRLDGESKLYYYRARYLNVEQGRFIIRDPLTGQPSAYEYTLSNPITHLDPLGLFIADGQWALAGPAKIDKNSGTIEKLIPRIHFSFSGNCEKCENLADLVITYSGLSVPFFGPPYTAIGNVDHYLEKCDKNGCPGTKCIFIMRLRVTFYMTFYHGTLSTEPIPMVTRYECPCQVGTPPATGPGEKPKWSEKWEDQKPKAEQQPASGGSMADPVNRRPREGIAPVR